MHACVCVCKHDAGGRQQCKASSPVRQMCPKPARIYGNGSDRIRFMLHLNCSGDGSFLCFFYMEVTKQKGHLCFTLLVRHPFIPLTILLYMCTQGCIGINRRHSLCVSADIWSLGVILFMLVCGQPPFQEANDSETLTMIMDCKYTVPPHISHACRE